MLPESRHCQSRWWWRWPHPQHHLRLHFCREKQAALAADEARRKAAVAERTQKFKEDVTAQMQHKERERLAQLQRQREELVKSMEVLEV